MEINKDFIQLLGLVLRNEYGTHNTMSIIPELESFYSSLMILTGSVWKFVPSDLSDKRTEMYKMGCEIMNAIEKYKVEANKEYANI